MFKFKPTAKLAYLNFEFRYTSRAYQGVSTVLCFLTHILVSKQLKVKLACKANIPRGASCVGPNNSKYLIKHLQNYYMNMHQELHWYCWCL